MPKTAIAISCLLLLVRPADVRAQRPPLHGYTTAQGLASNRVLRVVRDPRGFLWFCTANGVSRFDGTRMTTYDPDNGLPFTTINDLLITSRGEYLLASNGIGLIQFDVSARADDRRANEDDTQRTEAWRFRSHRLSDEGPANRVNRLIEDRQGRIWAATDGGLFVARGGTSPPAFRRVPVLEPAHDWSVQIWALADDPDGSLWIGTTVGLSRRLPDGRIVQYQWSGAGGRTIPSNVWALVRDGAGRLWIGHTAGVTVLAPEPAARAAANGLATIALPSPEPVAAGADVTLPARPGEARSWSGRGEAVPSPVMALGIGQDGHVWLSGNERVTAFDGTQFRPHDLRIPLASSDVAGIVEDDDGQIWTGSLGHGAIRILRGGFMTFSDAYGTIFEIEDGTVCAHRGGMLAGCFDGTRFANAGTNGQRERMPVPSVRTVLRDRTGAWWIGAQQGLYRFPPGRFADLAKRRPVVYTARDGLVASDVFSLFEDRRGDIWIGTFRTNRQVLTRWERATNRLHHYGADTHGLPPFSAASAFAEDRAGGIWILFREGHVARYQDGRFTVFRQRQEGAPVVSPFLHMDRRGRLWLWRDEGLLRVDRPEAGALDGKRYTKADGLATQLVNTLAEDRWGALYLGTSRGVHRLDPETGALRQYTEADGLAGNEVQRAFCDRFGALWFSGPSGLSRFVPRPDRATRAPGVAIGTAVVADRQVPLSALGDTDVDLGTLPGALRLRLDFFGSTFGVGPLRYRYKLEGADDDWSQPTLQQSVRYERLAPRRYRFLVRSVDAKGVTSPRAATVTFRVLPPLWQRWWVLAIAGVLAALALREGVRRRVARLVALERLRTRLATDLHDEIGSNLSQIAVLSEVLRQRASGGDPELPTRLERIADVSRASIAAMSDIVWAIDPQRDSAADLAQRMRRFANDLLTARDIVVRFTVNAAPATIVLDADVRRDVYLIFKEAVHNVARHAGATEAAIDLRLRRHELTLRVRDNGRGLDARPCDEGLGLRSMRARTARLRGELDVSSVAGQGACVALRVPLTPSRRRAAAG